MAFETLTGGLTLQIPTNGTINWGTNTRNNAWVPISNHKHQGSGDGNQLVTASYTDYSVTTIKLSKNYGWTEATGLAPAGTTETVDFNNGNVQFLSLASASGDVTVTFSNPAVGSVYRIWITQGATPRNVIWPAAVKWPQGVSPILSTANGAVDLVELYYTTSAVYRGEWELNFS